MLSPRIRAAAATIGIVVCVLAVWIATRRPADEDLLWLHWGFVGALVSIGASWLGAAALYVLFGPGSRRKRFIGVAVLSATSGLCLLLVEIPTLALDYDYGRLFGSATGDTWLDLAAGVNRADPELIHVHWPHSEYRGEVVGNLASLGIPNPPQHRVDLHYDHNGFRNDTDLERATIAAVGDSFVEGALTPNAETVSSRIGRELGVPVANLGQSAYGLRQELIVLERFALPLEPEWVVWFFFGGNDLRDVKHYESALARFGQEPAPRVLRERSFVRSALFALSSATTPRSNEPLAAARDRSARYARGTREPQIMYFGGETGRWSDHDWEVAVATLTEARNKTEAAGARFLLVYIPRKFTVYADLVEIAPGSLMEKWELVGLNTALGEWAASAGIDYIDLVKPLHEAAAAGDSPYFPDDVHWNSRGHEIAAQEIVEFIRQH